MKKYDCNKLLDFLHEWKRLCEFLEYKNCEIQNKDGMYKSLSEVDKCTINIVQKWSDEHQPKTRQDKFLEIFPNACIENGVLVILPCTVDYTMQDSTRCKNSSECLFCSKEYWNEEVEE